MNPKVRAGRRGTNKPAARVSIRAGHARRRLAFATTLAVVAAASAGCSSDSAGNSAPPGGSGPTAGPSAGVPSDTPFEPGPATPGTGGMGIPGPEMAGPAVPDPSGAVPAPNGSAPAPNASGDPPSTPESDDPYAIPDAPPASALIETPRVARLSRQQWSNTVRDLLYLSDISDIDEDVSGDALIGFDSEADALYVTEQLRRDLADAAERLADRVTEDPAALARLIPPDAPTELTERAHAFVESFGLRAFRRPLTEGEIATHSSLFDQGPTLYPGVDPFVAGASLVIQAMLQSPHFLYRTELGSDDTGDGVVPLDAYEVASKLAFALTNTMPDDELFAAAAAGELQDRASITAHAERLLDGPNGVAGLANFNFQVYRMGTYDGITRDPDIFPAFVPEAPASMRQEMLLFLERTFREGGGVKDYYTAPVGFANSALAPIYELDGTFSDETFTEVSLDPSRRSGLLTRAGFLSSYISGTDPDIIHRGVFIATRLLCVKLPPPDPNATSLVELQPNMTNRERVEASTGKDTCGEVCHSALFNPLGYAFENYDAIGQYRTTDRGFPVDAADSYTLDGRLQEFANGVELSQLLAEAKQTHSCYTRNLTSYLHGRLMHSEDEPMIDYYARLSRAGMLSVRDLVLDIVTGDSFLTRLP